MCCISRIFNAVKPSERAPSKTAVKKGPARCNFSVTTVTYRGGGGGGGPSAVPLPAISVERSGPGR